MYSTLGYEVDYNGSYSGLDDLGRDLICKKGNQVSIIQCKYWSTVKQIHEKHIFQLYGTLVSYCIENNRNIKEIIGILITNIELSDRAKKYAKYLGILYIEKTEIGEYPMIKCNIGRDQFGNMTKIYHLPFDQQYDKTKISKDGECYAFTVQEAEEKGFRRACKWFASE